MADHICANHWDPPHPVCTKCGGFVEPPYTEPLTGMYVVVVREDGSRREVPLEFALQMEVNGVEEEVREGESGEGSEAQGSA